MKNLMLVLVCLAVVGCAGKVAKPDAAAKPAAKQESFGPPMFSTQMGIEELEQGLAHHQTIGRVYKKRIAELEAMLKTERADHAIDRNAILNGKMDSK